MIRRYFPASRTDWVRTGILAGGYFTLAFLTFLLTRLVAGPSPFWPSAGFALAFLLIYGVRHWPGVFIGAATAVIVGVWMSAPGLPGTSPLLPLVATMGATVQAVIGRWLLVRYNVFPTRLTEPSEIGKFLLLAGPCASIVNATLTGFFAAFFGTWNIATILAMFTWYTSDVVGTILIAPAFVILHNAENRRAIQIGIPLVVAMLLVFTSYGLVRGLVVENTEAEFHRRAAPLARQIDRSLSESIQVVRSMQAFFESSQEVEGHEFHRFAKLLMPADLGVQTLEWTPRVPAANESTFAAFSSDGRLRFQLSELGIAGERRPVNIRPEYFPILFAEPEGGNDGSLGFDIASDPVRRDGLERAVKFGDLAVTGPVSLVQGGKGFLIAGPVYKGDAIPSDESGRRSALEGYVIGVFRIQALVDQALRGLDQTGLQVTLTDLTNPDRPLLLYGVPPVPQEGQRIVHALHRNFGGRAWVIALVGAPPFPWSEPGYLAWVVLAGGMLFAILLESLLLLITGRTALVESLVALRSAELQEAVEALHITNGELSRTLEERSRFYAKVTHELRTPLAGIKEGVGMVREGLAGMVNAEQQELLGLVDQEVQRLHRFINEVLDFSKLTSDPLSVLRPTKVDLNALVGQMVRSQQAVAAQKGLALQMHLDSTLPEIGCDADRMAQVILNLLSNALRLTQTGHVRVETRFHTGTREAEVIVSDSGPGIAPADQERIFKEFQQTRPGPGTTGLGLAISRQIVEKHGGRIWVESTFGSGASFHILLPAGVPT